MSGSLSTFARRPIRHLDATLVNQIAAGEVIARPASAIKELVENALDAEATRIAITVANEGRDLTVVDDGRGIPGDEIETALERHATSKITSFDDIEGLDTRGFRGEALASVASVARLRLVSRTSDENSAVAIEVRGGETVSRGPAGAPRGTRVEVTDLFENVPARRKFLRSPQAEFNAILRVVVAQAVSQPDVGFTLERVTDSGKSRVLDLPAEQTLRDRLAQVLGAEVGEHLVALDHADGDHLVTGFVAKPLMTRRDTRGQHLFVNGRPVANRRLGFALQQALVGMIMTGRKPIAAIFLECPAQTVDVNVHPTKEEVRFDDEDRAAGLVYRAVQAALEGSDLRPRMQIGKPGVPYSLPPGGPEASPSPPQPWSAAQPSPPPAPTPQQGTMPLTQAPAGEASAAPPPPAPPPAAEFAAPPVSDSAPIIDPLIEDSSTIVPLGQVGDSYIVAACGDDMLVIDQHAAHERLTYHDVQRRFAQQPEGVQPLLVPISFDLPATALSHLDELIPVFAHLGIEIEPFGGQTVIVRSLPSDFEKIDIVAVIRDAAADLEHGRPGPGPEQVRDRVLTRMACQAAVKANRRMTHGEMKALIDEIVRARLPHTCPHGRPTMALLTREQLDRQFKRT